MYWCPLRVPGKHLAKMYWCPLRGPGTRARKRKTKRCLRHPHVPAHNAARWFPQTSVRAQIVEHQFTVTSATSGQPLARVNIYLWSDTPHTRLIFSNHHKHLHDHSKRRCPTHKLSTSLVPFAGTRLLSQVSDHQPLPCRRIPHQKM